MAKKKGIIASLYAERKKAQLQREREQRAFERELAQKQRQAEAAEQRRIRLEDGKERERVRKAEAAAKERRMREERAEQEKVRLADLRAKEIERLRLRREAEKERDRARREQEKERLRLAAERQKAAEQERRRKAAELQRIKQEQRLEAEHEAAQRDAEAQTGTDRVNEEVERISTVLALRGETVGDLPEVSGEADVAAFVLTILQETSCPKGAGEIDVKYDDASNELMIKFDLPRRDVVPLVLEYKHLKTKKEIRPVPRKERDVIALYEGLVAQAALRILSEVFSATPADLVGGVVFNGHVSTIDQATGHPDQPLILSLVTSRTEFENLQLDNVEPVKCLHYLNAIVSPHPYDLEPVQPVWKFDPSLYKFVDDIDVVAGLDHRPDLLELSPTEFEHLVRRLYEAMGLKSWVTQASKDDGVDAVAVNEDPVLFGKCVIQAKRYKNIVDAESVYALAGVMEHHKASTGILVTTSWFGAASRTFATNHGRISLHDGRHLKHMLKENLGLDVLIGLPKKPPGWETSDIT